MLLIKIIRGIATLAVGAVITLICLTTALLCAACGQPANWVAKWWGWLLYVVECRSLGGIKLISHLDGDLPTEGQAVVTFGTHPLDPALPIWAYDVNRRFPGRHFATTSRDDHPLSPGFKAIDAPVINTKDGAASISALRAWLERHQAQVLVTIFPDVHRWSPRWHRDLWAGSAAEWGHAPHNYTLPWRAGGLWEIWSAMPEAAYYRVVLSFDQPAWGWRGYVGACGSTLLIRYTRVYPPTERTAFEAWLKAQGAEADRITGEIQGS